MHEGNNRQYSHLELNFRALHPVTKRKPGICRVTIPGLVKKYERLIRYGSKTAQEITVVQRPVSPSADSVMLKELTILPLIL